MSAESTSECRELVPLDNDLSHGKLNNRFQYVHNSRLQKLMNNGLQITDSENGYNDLDLASENQKLKRVVMEIGKKCSCLGTELKDTRKYAEFIEKQLQEANEAKNQLAETLKENEDTVEKLREEKKNMEAMMDELGRIWNLDIKKFQEDTNKINAEKTAIQEDLDTHKANTEMYKKQIEDAKKTIDDYTRWLKEEEESHRRTTRQIDRVQKDLNTVAFRCAELENEVVQLTNDNDNLTHQIRQNHDMYIAQSSELSTVLNELANKKTEGTEKMQFLADQYEIERQNHRFEIEKLTEMLEAAGSKNKIDECNAALAACRIENNSLKEDSNYSIQLKNEEIEFYKKEISQFKKENKKLQDGLSAFMLSNDICIKNFFGQKQMMEERLREKEEVCRNHREAHRELTSFLEKAKVLNDKTSAELRALQDRSNEMTIEMERLQEKVTMTKNDASTQKEAFDKKEKEMMAAAEEAKQKYQEDLSLIESENAKAKSLLESEIEKHSAEMEGLTRENKKLQVLLDGAQQKRREIATNFMGLNKLVHSMDLARMASQRETMETKHEMRELRIQYEKHITKLEKEHKRQVDDLGVKAIDEEPIYSEGEIEDEDEDEEEDIENSKEDDDDFDGVNQDEEKSAEWEVVNQQQ